MTKKGTSANFVPIVILLVLAGCSDYRKFDWGAGVGWEAARSRALNHDVHAMARSLERSKGSATTRSRADNGNLRHVVMPGETASGVAERYGLTLQQLVSANRLESPYTIYVGQVLRLRSSPPTPPSYRVKRGETLLAIAQRHGLTLDEVRRRNPGLNVDRIQAGQHIRLAQHQATRRQPASREASARRAQRVAATAPVPELSREGFVWPVNGTIVTRFGPSDDGRRSDGIDIAAAAGSTVRAAESGIVVYSGEDIPSMGRMLMIRHDGGFVTAYAHNRALLVRAGDAVRRGQPVAQVGATGDVEAPRLHFELRKGKRPIDPLRRLPKSGMRVASSG